MGEVWTWIALVGLGLATLVTRSGPLWSARPLALTEAQKFALQMAPMAALAAIVAPALLLTDGVWAPSLQDPRIWALIAAVSARLMGRGLLTILLSGLLVYGFVRLILTS
jgi:branched-subunit amino acid transport protein